MTIYNRSGLPSDLFEKEHAVAEDEEKKEKIRRQEDARDSYLRTKHLLPPWQKKQ